MTQAFLEASTLKQGERSLTLCVYVCVCVRMCFRIAIHLQSPNQQLSGVPQEGNVLLS